MLRVEWVLLLETFSVWLCWTGIQESSSHSSINPWTAGMRVEKRAWLRERAINIRRVGNIQELWNVMNVYRIKCLSSDVGKVAFWFWAELGFFFYGYFSVFCSEPAGGGHCGGSRCFRFEWQVVIYADLCSHSEPLDKSIIFFFFTTACKNRKEDTSGL